MKSFVIGTIATAIIGGIALSIVGSLVSMAVHD